MLDLSATPTLDPRVSQQQRLAAIERRLASLETTPIVTTIWPGATSPPVAASSVPAGSRGFARGSKYEFLSDGGVWLQSGAWT